MSLASTFTGRAMAFRQQAGCRRQLVRAPRPLVWQHGPGRAHSMRTASWVAYVVAWSGTGARRGQPGRAARSRAGRSAAAAARVCGTRRGRRGRRPRGLAPLPRARSAQTNRGVAGSTMRKEGIHPEWFPDAKASGGAGAAGQCDAAQRACSCAAAPARPSARNRASPRDARAARRSPGTGAAPRPPSQPQPTPTPKPPNPQTQVFCNGVEVMTVGGAKEVYNVDIYSGNHPWCGSASVCCVVWGQL
jgi:hypothetical protein